MNDFFTQPDVANPTAADERKTEVAPLATATAPEIGPDRRRRDSDLLVEPGADARAIARLIGQDIKDFLATALTNHVDSYRAKLRA